MRRQEVEHVEGGSRHHAHFYDDVGFLAERVGALFGEALAGGGAAIGIVRRSHEVAIRRALAADHDVDALTAAGRLVFLDAQATLDAILRDDMPDPAAFRERIGVVFARTRAACDGPLHAYGEMVDLLWHTDRGDAVQVLEDLWNQLEREHTFTLLCGYQLGAFAAHRHVHMFQEVCARHDEVSPPRGVEDGEAAEVITALEQRARALEIEVARRGLIEVRLEQLLAATADLAAATTLEEVARAAIDKGITAVGASYGGLFTVEHDQLVLLSVSELSPGDATRWAMVSLDADVPIAEVARTGAPIFLESLAAYEARFPASFLDLRPMLKTSELAHAILPLGSREGVRGVLALAYERAHRIEPIERTFLAILARQCGLALDRATLSAKEHAALETTDLLYRLAASCNRVDDVERVFALALDTIERATRSDRGAILLFDEAGTLRCEASHRLSAAFRTAVARSSPWVRDTRDPAPVVDLARDRALAPLVPAVRAEGIGALVFVPLVHHHALLGELVVARDEERPFTPRDLQLVHTAALHVAQAVARQRGRRDLARSLEQERQARLAADEAIRAREEILAVVSHDLRNPLGAIMIGTSLLDDDEHPLEVRRVAGRIHRQAERMNRLLGDLLDFASIQSGRLAISRGRHPPEQIIAQASDLFGPLAGERGLAFEASAEDGLPLVDCDPDRALQIFGNLVANAIKVTPRGGKIAVGARPDHEGIVFYVRDTGPGIQPDDLPRLFERYFRAKDAIYRGTGLGLSIARGLVDAHGGRIWAESQPGAGSTFYFSLPPSPSG